LDEDGSSNGHSGLWKGTLQRLLFGRRRALTEKDLQEIIQESEQEGLINEDEGEMLHSIFEFGDTIVREVMVPRPDMVCCSSLAQLPEVLEAILSSGHSRIPIFEGVIDRIVGVVYAKDLLRYWGAAAEDIRLTEVMRPPFFVPESKNIEDLLQDFRSRRVHMAIAIDEYGGTSGLITIEDLIEEIIGDIQDEYDTEEEWLIEEGDGSALVDGRLNIEDLEEHFAIQIPREKFDTVGGYVIHLLGHVPRQGEEVCDASLSLTAVDADERKVRKVHVRLLRDPASGESSP